MSKQEEDLVECLFDNNVRRKLPRAAAENPHLRQQLGFTVIADLMPPVRISAVSQAPQFAEPAPEEQSPAQEEQAPVKRGPGRPKASNNAH